MVIDQDETPLFLGAIHRLLHGVKLGDLLAAAAGAGAEVTTIDEAEAVAALAPDTLVLTDGAALGHRRLRCAGGTAMVQLVDDRAARRAAQRPSRLGYAHSVAAGAGRR